MAIETWLLSADDVAVLEHVAPDVFDHAIEAGAAARFLADPRHHLAVALEEGQVVGFASGLHYFHPDKPTPELFVNEVGVSPAHQDRGIGKAVLHELLRAARTLGCAQAWVLTDHDNAAANGLYRTCGGKVDEPRGHLLHGFDLRE